MTTENTPCVECGDDQTPLHPNHFCGNCYDGQTVADAICQKYVNNMTLEELRQFVFENLVALSDHGDEDLILMNFWDLPEVDRVSIQMRFPSFDTGEPNGFGD